MVKKKKATKTELPKANVGQYGLLRRALTTEKTTLLGGAGAATVAFEVAAGASKPEIKSAVERVFGVSVKKVRTCRYVGKIKRTTKAMGRTRGFKKAYVTLQPGQTINVIEGI